MVPDVSNLANHSGVDQAGLAMSLDLFDRDLSPRERSFFHVMLAIADRSANTSTPTPDVFGALTALTREAARGMQADGDQEAALSESQHRTISAKTLHLLRELNLYQDLNFVEPVWPHAGMLILNPVLGCSFGCVYCFRADEQRESPTWFLNGRPTQVISDEAVVERLEAHPLFRPGETQIGLHTATTEPFLPQVRPSTFRLLELLAERGHGNDVMVITKHFLRDADVARLASFTSSFRILLFLTYNAAPAGMETLGAAPGFRERKWRTAELVAAEPRLAAAHYYRPIVPGWNDDDRQIEDALRFGEHLGVTVIGGLKAIPDLATLAAMRGLRTAPTDESSGLVKHFPPELVERILRIHDGLGLTSTVVGDQSCGLTLMLSGAAGQAVPNVEAVRMFDRANAPAPPKCMGRCSKAQLAACAAPPRPTAARLERLLADAGAAHVPFRIADDGVHVRASGAVTPQLVESLAAHLRYAVFVEGGDNNLEASTPPERNWAPESVPVTIGRGAPAPR